MQYDNIKPLSKAGGKLECTVFTCYVLFNGYYAVDYICSGSYWKGREYVVVYHIYKCTECDSLKYVRSYRTVDAACTLVLSCTVHTHSLFLKFIFAVFHLKSYGTIILHIPFVV